MALFHLSVTQTKRSAGQSAIASAAYRAGERLYSEYYGEYSDYTRKGGVICSDILLPSHAPKEYADRQTLWNAVEKAERGKTAQLAYSFEISLQNEFSLEENIALARKFLLEQFVSRGMTVDVSFHEKEHEDGGTPNPHFHFLCPIRPIEQDGTWGLKQRRVYALDEDGNRIRDQNGEFVFNAVPTTDWGSPETLEHWRQTWAEMCNAKFAEKGLTVRKETIDSFNTSDTRGNSPSYGTSFQKMGHELLSRDELAVLDGGKCILQLRGVRPFLSDKYDLTQHPNYKLTSDYDPKNTFDIEKYLNRKEKIHPGDEFIVVDADSLPSA